MRNEVRNVNKHCKILKNIGLSFKDFYDVSFSNKNSIYIEYTDDNNNIISLTYNEVDILIDNFAYSLKERLNVTNEFIALNIDNSKEWIIAFWGIIKSGNNPFLINLRQPLRFINEELKTLNVKYSISIGKSELDCENIEYDSLNKFCPLNYEFIFGEKIALSTSGTSLKKKVCVYEASQIIYQVKNSSYILKNCAEVQKSYKKRVKLLAFLPFFHIFGLIATYLWFSFFGYTMVFLKDYSSSTILNTIRKHQITHLFSVPILWEKIVKEIRKEVSLKDEKTQKKFERAIDKSNKLQNNHKLLAKLFYKKAFKEIREKTLGDSVQFSISGGSYIKDDTLRILNGLGYHLHCGYGSTEIGITSIDLSTKTKTRLLNSIGKPLQGIEYKIEDEVLFVKAITSSNEIYVDGTLEKNEEWFNTHDFAYIDDHGNYYLKGRDTDVIIGENGENINPDMIEKELSFTNEVLAYSVIGIEDEVSLILQLRKNVQKEYIIKLLDYINEVNTKFDSSMMIKKVYGTFNELMNPNEIKVSREKIKRFLKENKIILVNLKNIGDLDSFFEETETYLRLRKLVAESLNIDENTISPSSHFLFDLGGTSLDYYELLNLIFDEFNVRVETENGITLFTLKELTEYIEKRVK